jgi:16S rRNA (uracil1498-N3)-methyltransferase
MAEGDDQTQQPFMHRFFVKNLDLHQSSLIIQDLKEIHHIKNVLRFKKTDLICLFNDQGEEVVASIQDMKANSLIVKVEKYNTVLPQNTIFITLACAIPKKAKFETIIEKTTELGVNEIIPLITHRTDVRLSVDRREKKETRYQTIAVNAAKQCGRANMPTIHPVTKFSDFIKSTKINQSTLALIPCLPEKNNHINTMLTSHKDKTKFIILIGPEGDFTPKEIQSAQDKGCIPVSLGYNILKVDTAAISTVGFIQFSSHPHTR